MKTYMKKAALVLGAVMISAALMTGCGSSSTSSSQTPAAAQKTSLDAIKEKGKLVIATSGNFSPMTYVDGKGELTGFDIELGKALAKSLGVEAEFITGNIAGLIPGMQAGKFDLVMSGLTATPTRKQSIDFTQAYGTSAHTAVALVSNKSVKGLDDLNGLVVGCLSGTPQHEWVVKKGGFKEMKEYPGNAEAFTDLKTGRIDVYVVSTIVASDYIKKDANSDNPLHMIGTPVDPIEMAVGMPKDQPELKAALDETIKKLAADGTLDKLGEKYVGQAIPRPAK